jgi:hypothetical protein
LEAPERANIRALRTIASRVAAFVCGKFCQDLCMKPKLLTYLLGFSIASLSGCTTWNTATLSRPLPVAESPAPEPPIRFADLPKSGGEKGIEKSVKPIEPNERTEVASANFSLPTWPDHLYWDDVYRQINEADTRRVEKGRIVNPLQPLPMTNRKAEPNPHTIADVAFEPIPKTQDQSERPEKNEPRKTLNPIVDEHVEPAQFTKPEIVEPENTVRSLNSCTGLSGLTLMSLHAADVCREKGVITQIKTAQPKATIVSPGPNDFRQKLCELRNALKVELDEETNSDERKQSLQLAQQIVTLLESRDMAVPAISGYLEPQISAIETLLHESDVTNMVAIGKKAGQTLEHLRAAEVALQAAAGLKIQNATFCTEVLGFGQFRECKSSVFMQQQQLLIYCEVENHVSKVRTENSQVNHVTRLQTALTICNPEKAVVQQIDYPTVEDVARSARRDFYIYVPVTMGNLPAGNYSLYLTVTDLEGNKTTTLDPPLPFSIR